MNRLVKFLIVTVIVVIALAILFSAFGFVAHKVNTNEVGVILNKGEVVDVVGPGIYSRLGLWWDIEDIKIEGITVCASDPEVLTSDQQRIGVETCSTVHRPDETIGTADYARVFRDFRSLLMSDEALAGIYEDGILIREGKMQEIAKQAMKSCVGDRKFEEAAVGASRDELRECLLDRENIIATGYLLEIKNVTVPNIEIHPTVQDKLDLITEEKFQTDVERQETLRIRAEAEKELAREEGAIKVSQGTIQEEHRQAAITADLERQALEAQQAVIEAQKNNDLLSAELDEAIAEQLLLVQQIDSLASIADEQALAEMYSDNTRYMEFLVKLANAEAWNLLDKVIVPVGTSPDTVLSPTDDITTVIGAGE
jgi:hypothetical protein